MPKFERLEIWTDYQAAGGTAVIDVPDPLSLRANFNIEHPDQEGLSFSLATTSRVRTSVTSRRVARVVFTDGTFDEWKILKDSNSPLRRPGLFDVTASPPIFALVECGIYYTTGATGVRYFSYSADDVTPSAALTAFVFGTPDCPTWIALGTVTPTVKISISGEFATPLAIAIQIRDAVRAKGIACELRLRRNGTTQYLLDLVTSVGSSAAVPEIRAAKQLIDYAYQHDTTKQATRIIPRGPVDAFGYDATLARARFTVTAVNGGTLRLTLADEAGGAGPIAYNDQYVGWYLFREKTGRTFQIVHSYAATQEIELASVSNFAAHSATAPEWVSFRLTEALNGTRIAGTIAGTWKLYWFAISAINAGTKTFTLSDDWTTRPSADEIITNDEWVDWKAIRAVPVGVSPTGFNPTPGFVGPLSSVASIAVGDIIIERDTGVGPPYTTRNPPLVVDAIDSGTKVLTVHTLIPGASVTQYYGGASQSWDVYRINATHHLITDSDATAETIQVDAVGTAAVGDIILEIYQPCQGTFPYYVESPTDLASYGKKIAVLARPETGEVNLVPNPCMRTWTTPSNPPDGWTRTVGSGSPTHSQELTITRQGGASWLVEIADSGKSTTIKSPAAYPNPISEANAVSVRVKLYFPSTSLTGGSYCTITARKVDRAGNTLTSPWTTYAITLVPKSYGAPGAGQVTIERDAWVTAAIENLSLSTFTTEGILVEITGLGTVDVYIDAVQITQTATAPRDEPELAIEFSEGTKLLQVANLELAAWASPPVFFSMSAADLEAIDPTLFSEDKITLGGTLRAVDPDASVDVSLRVMEFSPDYLNPANGTFSLATLPSLLSSLLAEGA